tara:strand:+ start:910 stop:1284 length:375 start_codon:yes stop_codon:yes gene_type:complete
MAIYRQNEIRIDLTELVSIRSSFLEVSDEMTDDRIEELTHELQYSLTWDTLYGMVDSAILEYLDKPDPNRPHYGEIAGDEPAKSFEEERKRQEKAKKEFEKNFDMVDLEGGSWTIQVPVRKTNA